MLGIAKPWQVTGVQVSLADDEVEVTVGMDAGAHFIQQLRLGRLRARWNQLVCFRVHYHVWHDVRPLCSLDLSVIRHRQGVIQDAFWGVYL